MSTVVTLGVVPVLSMLSVVWETPGLMVITKIIPAKDESSDCSATVMSGKLDN